MTDSPTTATHGYTLFPVLIAFSSRGVESMLADWAVWRDHDRCRMRVWVYVWYVYDEFQALFDAGSDFYQGTAVLLSRSQPEFTSVTAISWLALSTYGGNW